MPRFLAEDLPLFHAIVSDLYPDVTVVPTGEYASLEAAAAAQLTAGGRQLQPSFLGKVIELQQTLRVRFGVMLVGPAGGGKSTVLATLRDSLTALHAEGSADPAHQRTHTVVFNPKCARRRLLGAPLAAPRHASHEPSRLTSLRVSRAFASHEPSRLTSAVHLALAGASRWASCTASSTS